MSVSGTQGPQKTSVRGTLGLQTGSRCMETTIRSDISSPSTSGNNPRLAYIWMYVSWDIYRDTYLDIWVRRVIIIIGPVIVMLRPLLYLLCYDSSYVSCYTCYVMIPAMNLVFLLDLLHVPVMTIV